MTSATQENTAAMHEHARPVRQISTPYILKQGNRVRVAAAIGVGKVGGGSNSRWYQKYKQQLLVGRCWQ